MKTLHVVGDSISIHYGPYLERYLGPAFSYSRKEGEIGNLDRPEGANGGDSSMVLKYLRECVAAGESWDVLVLNCGLHDVKRYDGQLQVSADDYRKNLAQILGEVGRQLTDYIVWIRTTSVIDDIHNSRIADFERFDADVEQYNAIADEEAFAADWIIDLNTFSRSLGGTEIVLDHIHYTEPARQLQGAFIAGHINGFFA